jgi:tetratricopeptide (TPR) repeat protein
LARPAQLFAEALAFHQQGRISEAEHLYRMVLKSDPHHFDALHNLGLILLRSGKPIEAVVLLRKALNKNAKSAKALNTFGLALQALNRSADAVTRFEKAITIKPNYAEAHNNLGLALQSLDRHEDAIACFEKALTIKPDLAGAHNNIGLMLVTLNRPEEAVARYEKALTLQPNLVDARVNLANALQKLGRFEDAIANFRKAVAIRPNNPEAFSDMGNLLQELGRFDEAQSAYEQAIKYAPRTARYYRQLAASKRFAADDKHLATMEALAREIGTLSGEEQEHLHFALGKAYDDLGRYRAAFRHLLLGNTLKRRHVDYDEPATIGLFDRTRVVFTPELMREREGVGEPSTVPIFILGMPRSGTTLIEQILASHPKVFGAGELADIEKSVAGLANSNDGGVGFPEVVATLTGEQIRQFGKCYLDRIRALAPGAEYITDKMPSNFRFAGLIHLAMPNAHIIHARRDPIDTCLSCFSKLFVGTQPFCYDLAELGRYYRAYQRMMAHWQAVLPPNTMLEVQYEELVADLEGQARRLLAYCGLEWDDACLAFHKTQRPIRTASVAQVRQAIYNTSVGRWRPYKVELEPLLEALGIDLVDDPAVNQVTSHQITER